jgi:hypothetical protein
LGGAEVGADVVSVVAVATVLFLLLGAVFGLRLFALEPGARERFAADHVQKSLDASIKVVCSLHVPSTRRGFSQESPKGTPLCTR